MIEQKYRWKIDRLKIEEGNDEDIISNNNINPIIEKLLIKRNIDSNEKIKRFLYDGIDKLYSPLMLKDMDKAVQRIIRAKENDEKITIYGDYDVDGITSTAVLYSFLNSIGCNVTYYIPSRLSEGYGMNKKAINGIAKDETTLIVTVDTGITAIEEAKLIQELGMELVITDHHEVQGDLPDAVAVVNPKREDNEYPFRDLAGVGVSYKLVMALEEKLGIKDDDKNKEYLELVTLGTIADVVSMLDENRIIVREGLNIIKNTTNVGLKALIEATKIGEKEKLSTKDIGFIIAPKLNAAGRLGDAKIALELLLEKDKEKAQAIASELLLKNIERQTTEQSIYNEAVEIIEKDTSLRNSNIIIVKGNGWNHGVIGIVASRLVSKFYKPVIIFNEEDEKLSGSARSIEDVNIFKIIEKGKELLLKFGGHEGAAGLSLKSENYEKFKELVIDIANKEIDDEMLIPSCYIDLEIKSDEVTEELIKELSILEPYGPGNEKPIFKISGVISNANLMGKNLEHLKLKIKSENNSIDGVFFHGSNVYKDIIVDEEYEIVGELEINEFNNTRSMQCMMIDLANSSKYMNDTNYYVSLYRRVIENIEKEDFIDENAIRDINVVIEKIHNTKNLLLLINDYNSFNEIIHLCNKGTFNDRNAIINYNNLELIKKSKSPNSVILVNSTQNYVDLGKNYNIISYEASNNAFDEKLISKDEVTKVYKRLQFIQKINKDSVDLEEMRYNIKDLNTYQIMISLKILEELGIIKVNVVNLQDIKFNINKGIKNKIENSKIYNLLKQK